MGSGHVLDAHRETNQVLVGPRPCLTLPARRCAQGQGEAPCMRPAATSAAPQESMRDSWCRASPPNLDGAGCSCQRLLTTTAAPHLAMHSNPFSSRCKFIQIPSMPWPHLSAELLTLPRRNIEVPQSYKRRQGLDFVGVTGNPARTRNAYSRHPRSNPACDKGAEGHGGLKKPAGIQQPA